MPLDPSSAGYSFAMQSSVGRKRSGNEDFCAASPENGVFVVCDGMGGAAAGEVASKLAAETFVARLKASEPVTEQRMHDAVLAANAAVYSRSVGDDALRGMGATLVGIALKLPVRSESTLYLAHVGDSRCYRLRGGQLVQMTEDHSLVQQQIKAGQLTPEQAERSPMRNIITRVIGSGATVKPEVQALQTAPGDIYLLASDGLTRELSDAEISAHLSAGGPLEPICAGLLEAANAAGGRDNITALLLRIGG